MLERSASSHKPSNILFHIPIVLDFLVPQKVSSKVPLMATASREHLGAHREGAVTGTTEGRYRATGMCDRWAGLYSSKETFFQQRFHSDPYSSK
jgi:hypothetical protein